MIRQYKLFPYTPSYISQTSQMIHLNTEVEKNIRYVHNKTKRWENTQRKFKSFGLIRSNRYKWNTESVAAAYRRRLLSNPDMNLQKTQKENVKYAGFITWSILLEVNENLGYYGIISIHHPVSAIIHWQIVWQRPRVINYHICSLMSGCVSPHCKNAKSYQKYSGQNGIFSQNKCTYT